jgi:hypothetical protein
MPEDGVVPMMCVPDARGHGEPAVSPHVQSPDQEHSGGSLVTLAGASAQDAPVFNCWIRLPWPQARFHGYTDT